LKGKEKEGMGESASASFQENFASFRGRIRMEKELRGKGGASSKGEQQSQYLSR